MKKVEGLVICEDIITDGYVDEETGKVITQETVKKRVLNKDYAERLAAKAIKANKAKPAFKILGDAYKTTEKYGSVMRTVYVLQEETKKAGRPAKAEKEKEETI